MGIVTIDINLVVFSPGVHGWISGITLGFEQFCKGVLVSVIDVLLRIDHHHLQVIMIDTIKHIHIVAGGGLDQIDRYANNDACAPLVALEQIEDIHAAVRAFLEAAIDYSTDHDSGAKGCFLASCVSTSAGHVDGVSELLHEAITATDVRITARFDLEKKKRMLPRRFPSAERARLLFDLRQGLVFRARAGFSAKALSKDLANLVQLVLADIT